MATIPTIPPVGISNLGNTCYINAVLQCIRACKSVTNIIESVANTLAMENNKELHLAPELHDIFKIMNGGSGVNPSRFIHFLRTSKLLGSEFNVQHPNDMVEFFISLQHIIRQEIISEGGITGTVADPRIILKKALDHHAVSIILCHNHPSGNLKPSKADELLTTKIKNAAAFLDIQVMDHIIVSEEGYYSFADEGLM